MLVADGRARPGGSGTLGIGPPELDPRHRRGQGASSTWLNGRECRAPALRRVIGATCAPRRAPPSPSQRRLTGPGGGDAPCSQSSSAPGRAGIAGDGRVHHGPNNGAGERGHNPLPLPDVTVVPGPQRATAASGCLDTALSGVRPRLRTGRNQHCTPKSSLRRQPIDLRRNGRDSSPRDAVRGPAQPG